MLSDKILKKENIENIDTKDLNNMAAYPTIMIIFVTASSTLTTLFGINFETTFSRIITPLELIFTLLLILIITKFILLVNKYNIFKI